jgi:glycosyltransferase involved in cell wall biosynthesis
VKVLVFIESTMTSRFWEAAVPLLRERGIDVWFASLRKRGPLSDELERRGIAVHTLGAETSRDYPLAAWRLRRLVQQERFDIVHACEWIPAAVSGVALSLLKKPLRVFHRQHIAPPDKNRIFHDLANRTSHVTMACSLATKTFAHESDGFAAERIYVAYNGIVPMRAVAQAEVDAVRQQLQIPADAGVISMVARLRREKGHATLFEAADRVARASKKPLHVVVTGSGVDQAAIEQAARSYETFTTHFTGHQEDVALWFSVGDVVAMPSEIEAFGIAAVEAMSCGKALIASAVGGLVEVIEDGVSGILVPPRDPEGLGEAIARVLTNPPFARELGDHARERAHRLFSMEAMVDGWIETYRAATGV